MGPANEVFAMKPRGKKIIYRLLFMSFVILGLLAFILPRARVILLCCAMVAVLAPEFFEGILSKRGKLKSP
jgi:hypothetical protein